MKESILSDILGRLGIRHERPKKKTDRDGHPVAWLDFPCPLSPWTHEKGRDTRPSAGAIATEHGASSWKCHTCKNHGRISSLIAELQQLRGETYPGLMRLAEEADILNEESFVVPNFDDPHRFVNERPEPIEEAQFAGLYPPASSVPLAVEYLAGRHIRTETADELGLVWEDRQRRILFPVRGLQGELYGFTGRAVDEETKPKIKDYFGLPKRFLILGAHRWVEHKPVLIVEGLFGFASLVDVGAEQHFNVGAILGSEMTPEKAALLREFGEAVFLMLDNDAAGDDGIFGHVLPSGERDPESGAVARLKGHVLLYLPVWPEGKEDPDQLTLEDVEAMLDTPVYTGTVQKDLTKNVVVPTMNTSPIQAKVAR